MARKALAKAPVSLNISHYTDEQGVYHLDTEQRALGRVVRQESVIDGVSKIFEHPAFGRVAMTSTWTSVDTIVDDFLKENLEAGTTVVVEIRIAHLQVGWVSRQIHGIEVIEGTRYHTRRMMVTDGQKVIRTRLVFDWQESC